MDSQAFIIQDSDIFLKALVEIKKDKHDQEAANLLKKQLMMKTDPTQLVEQHMIVTLQLSDSLKRNNILRLIERGGQ